MASKNSPFTSFISILHLNLAEISDLPYDEGHVYAVEQRSSAKVFKYDFFLLAQFDGSPYLIIRRTMEYLIIIMVIFKCHFSREHIALSYIKNGVNIELGKTNRLKALCMMQSHKQTMC